VGANAVILAPKSHFVTNGKDAGSAKQRNPINIMSLMNGVERRLKIKAKNLEKALARGLKTLARLDYHEVVRFDASRHTNFFTTLYRQGLTTIE
jgi:hypothetical protein